MALNSAGTDNLSQNALSIIFHVTTQFAGAAADFSEIARIAQYSLFRDHLHFIYRLQRRAGFNWMKVQ